MKRLLLALLLFSSPAFSQITKESVKEMANILLLDCKEYGINSCASRIIALSACTYAMGVNQGIEPVEAQEISQILFTEMSTKHQIPYSSLFDSDDTMKDEIKAESLERIFMCKDSIAQAIPIMHEAFNGTTIPEDKIEEIANLYPFWYIEDMEQVYKTFY